MENRFLEAEMEFKGIAARGRRVGGPRALATSYGTSRSFDWARSQSAAQRALVILIDNGGVDLGIPDLVDKILSFLPGSSLLPDGIKQKLVDFLRSELRKVTDDLLETAELTANRYTAAKPDLYADVTILRNSTATLSNLKNTLISLSQAGKIIDIFVLTHGSPDTIWAEEKSISGDALRQIKAEYGKPLSIRSVYQMNCYGDSLQQAWHDAGARVCCGSTDINYLPEPTMFFFWKNWKDGQTFERAAISAFESTVSMMNAAVGTFLGPLPTVVSLVSGFDFHDFDFVKGSAPKVVGQKDLTIASDDVSFTQSAFPAMATTLVPSKPRSRAMDDGNAGVLTVSAAGVEFVKQWEGFVPKLYNDPVGHCTVGYGTLLHRGNCDGRDSEQPYLNGVSKEEATRLLAAELDEKQKAVRDAVKVTLNQNQYDALVSFAYNVGAGAFGKSTLLKLLNQGKYDAVPGELKKWSKARDQDGSLVELPGLAKRRAAEATLFQAPVAAAAQSLSRSGLGAFGRSLSRNGLVVPVRHSSRYRSSGLASSQSRLSVQQNPVALVAGIEIADAIQIGLAAAGIVQSQINGAPGPGTFHLFYDKAQRLLTPEARAAMPGAAKAKRRYSYQLFFIGGNHPLISDAYASVIIEWGGNIYGEIETPEIRKDNAKSTDWQHSSNDLAITNVARIPKPGTDPRTWPLTYTYEGTFDPVGNGYFEYSGEFEVNAFGRLHFNRHDVFTRSLIDWAIAGQPEDYVQQGDDVNADVPDIPKEQLDYLRTKLPS